MIQSRSLLQSSVQFNRVTRRLGHKLVLRAHGKLQDVIELQPQERPRLSSPDKVLLGVLATNINPADLNIVEGRYPIRPTLPGVFGYDGVAQVLEVGQNVTKVKVGDRVWPDMVMGMFQTYLECSPDEIGVADPRLSVEQAATLIANPGTAYKMIKMGALKKGDTVIQNAANSAVGQCVIQIARAWSLNTINIVRPRADMEQTRKMLTDMGASIVISEDELKDEATVKALWSKVPRPKLALNAVSGKSVLRMTLLMDKGGLCVTYGGMSGEPLLIPSQSFIFQDVRFAGFWLGNWRLRTRESEQGKAEWANILRDLTQLSLSGALKPPVCEFRAAADWLKAFQITYAGGKATNTTDPSTIHHRPKQVLTFYDPCSGK